jgi:hypothetical protein
MAHVLFAQTTAVVPIDPDITTPFDPSELLAEQPTEETPVFSCAYLVEVRSPVPRLLAIRDTFEDARLVAQSYLLLTSDVSIREVPLPCDVSAFLASHHRVWSRGADGTWAT